MKTKRSNLTAEERLQKQHERNVAAGKKGGAVRWKTRHEIIIELSKEFGDDKARMDEFQFKWKTNHLIELINWIRKYHNKK
jgi:hypothetical protein